MTKDLAYYLKKFAKLGVDRAHGVAPHKPTLLLAIAELFEQNKIDRNQIYLSPELIATFLKYWSNLVTTDHRSDIALPFFHLTGDKFWHLMPNPGFEATIATRTKIKGLAALRNAVKYAYLDEELFEYLKASKTRHELVQVLIHVWFPEKTQKIAEINRIDELENIQLRLFERGGATYTTADIKDQDKTFVRNAAFRRIIVSLYDQHCAFCRLKIVSRDSQNIIDGAHIKPFSEFRDDLFDNGLALCKNHHWAFDRGWFSITDDYRILIPHDRFHEESPIDTRTMRDFHGEVIFLPAQENFYPRIESIRWHRERWNIA